MMMKIDYFTSCGKGTVTLNLDELLPCTQKKFKLILDICEKSEKCYDHVSFLYDFIAGKIEQLKSDRSKLNENSGFDKPVISKINTEMKKWLALSGLISKSYGFEEIADTDASIKMKRSTIYAIKDDSVIDGARKLLAEKMVAAGFWTQEQAEEHIKKSDVAPEVVEAPEAVEVVTVPDVVPVTATHNDTVTSWTVRRMIIYREFGKSEKAIADIADCDTVKPYKPQICADNRTRVYLFTMFKKSANKGKYKANGTLPNPPPLWLCGVRSP